VIDRQFSQMEQGVLGAFHDKFHMVGFPAPSKIAILARRNTGAGRYLDLESTSLLQVEDGYLDLGGRFLRIPGVENGLMAVVAVEGGQLRQLEISVYGEQPWDGSECGWTIC
jgi:hypothetical protein